MTAHTKRTIDQAKEGQREFEKEKDAIRSNAPHLREGNLLEHRANAIKKKQFGRARIIEKMMAEEHSRRQYGRMRHGVEKPKAQPVA